MPFYRKKFASGKGIKISYPMRNKSQKKNNNGLRAHACLSLGYGVGAPVRCRSSLSGYPNVPLICILFFI
jgi:hypothetical protein